MKDFCASDSAAVALLRDGRNAEAAARYAAKFPAIKLANIGDFGGWTKAQATHFADGGVFDQIYTPGGR